MANAKPELTAGGGVTALGCDDEGVAEYLRRKLLQ